METESADSAKVLASIVLNQVPEDRRPDAYQAITSRLESSSAWPPDFAAAHLVAQLAQNDPEGGCSFNALCTFVKKIVESIPDSGDFPDMVSFREVAAFCYRYPQIMEKTISDINLDIERNVLGLEPPVGFAGHDEDDHAGLTLTSKYLALLRVFLLINPDCASRSSLSHLSSLFKLVRAPYKKVAYAARDVLYAWFDGNLESQPVKELNEMIWQHIVELITTMEAPLYQDIAFGIWLKWVDLRAWFCLAPAVISNDLYWTFLQSGLKDGSSERRKQCLYILMNTLPHIRESVRTEHFIYDIGERATLQILWAKYCTLFETIALERALNQIEDALPELHGLIESSLLIHGTWITTLLTVGLQPSMPDNIKKLLVSFLMSLRSSKELLFLEYFQDIVSGKLYFAVCKQ
ncbi:MAG: hypothetical protein M1819_000293 [Sarea resinae]|nr:MAG: hypothetical protein M1819_000293 [Sarea resinae]